MPIKFLQPDLLLHLEIDFSHILGEKIFPQNKNVYNIRHVELCSNL